MVVPLSMTMGARSKVDLVFIALILLVGPIIFISGGTHHDWVLSLSGFIVLLSGWGLFINWTRHHGPEERESPS